MLVCQRCGTIGTTITDFNRHSDKNVAYEKRWAASVGAFVCELPVITEGPEYKVSGGRFRIGHSHPCHGKVFEVESGEEFEWILSAIR